MFCSMMCLGISLSIASGVHALSQEEGNKQIKWVVDIDLKSEEHTAIYL